MAEKLRVGSVVPYSVEGADGVGEAVLTQVRENSVEGFWFCYHNSVEKCGPVGTADKKEFPREESGFLSMEELARRVARDWKINSPEQVDELVRKFTSS